MRDTLRIFAGLFFLLAIYCSPAFAQDEPGVMLTEADLLAAVEAACDCTLEEEEPPVEEEVEDEEEEEGRVRNCTPLLSKLRKSVSHVLKPLNLIESTFDEKAFTKDQKKKCREARRAKKKKEKEEKAKGKENGKGKGKNKGGDHDSDDDDDDDSDDDSDDDDDDDDDSSEEESD